MDTDDIADVAEEISKRTGRTITFQDISLEAYTDMRKKNQVPGTVHLGCQLPVRLSTGWKKRKHYGYN